MEEGSHASSIEVPSLDVVLAADEAGKTSVAEVS